LWLKVAAGASKADNIDEDDERIGDREEYDARYMRGGLRPILHLVQASAPQAALNTSNRVPLVPTPCKCLLPCCICTMIVLGDLMQSNGDLLLHCFDML
jgi:hypothetical protein